MTKLWFLCTIRFSGHFSGANKADTLPNDSKTRKYVTTYTPSLLESILRENQRRDLGIAGDVLPFEGVDTWNAWEFTWLGPRGKPEIATARFQVPGDSPRLIESRSLKLYLGSYSNTRFDRREEVALRLESDLAQAAGAAVGVSLLTPEEIQGEGMGRFDGDSLDGQDLEMDEYRRNPDFLAVEGAATVSESLHTHLLKTLCPVTGHPDFASVLIRYKGKAISREGLLRYLVSYRQHAEFAEQVTERIFVDIMNRCSPRRLAVTARYTRRGGIDINATRTFGEDPPAEARLWRQ